MIQALYLNRGSGRPSTVISRLWHTILYMSRGSNCVGKKICLFSKYDEGTWRERERVSGKRWVGKRLHGNTTGLLTDCTRWPKGNTVTRVTGMSRMRRMWQDDRLKETDTVTRSTILNSTHTKPLCCTHVFEFFYHESNCFRGCHFSRVMQITVRIGLEVLPKRSCTMHRSRTKKEEISTVPGVVKKKFLECRTLFPPKKPTLFKYFHVWCW